MICFRLILQKRDDPDVDTMAMPHVTLIDVQFSYPAKESSE